MYGNDYTESAEPVPLYHSGPAQGEPAEDEEGEGAELDEEEELETVRVSETEFNFLDFIKR